MIGDSVFFCFLWYPIVEIKKIPIKLLKTCWKSTKFCGNFIKDEILRKFVYTKKKYAPKVREAAKSYFLSGPATKAFSPPPSA